jgi:hypothetical protein
MGQRTFYINGYSLTINDSVMGVKRVIFNYPATIVIWDDNSKTVVKATEDEEYFDPRLGFLTAYYQKHCGMSKTKANKKLDEIENKFYEEWVE